MTAARSDALVFFGATGDLAYKKIFPALQSLVRRNQRVNSFGTERQYFRTQPRCRRGEIGAHLPRLLRHLLGASDARVDVSRHIRVDRQLRDTPRDRVAERQRLVQIVGRASEGAFARRHFADLDAD